MGTSWHAFLTGALDPGATLAIDKPPGFLWLQVAATKALGFGSFALHLPAALAGCLAVVALYDALRTLFGRSAGLAGALALAVLPVAVITARSDTMDSLVAALDVVALALVARAVRWERPWLLVGAGLTLGLTFEVKPFEGLVAAPALALLAWLGLRHRVAPIAAAGAVLVAAALAWLVALPLLGGAHLPWAYGSANGSAWNAAFLYDGLHRLGAHAAAATTPVALARVPAPPGPLRLFEPRAALALRVGLELAAALLVALLVGMPRRLDRAARAGWWGLLAWLVTGVVLASAQGGLRPRYLEAVDPAIAAVLGVGAVLAARRWALAGAGVVLLASLVVSVGAVAHRVEDSGAPGALPAARIAALDTWLQARGGEVASAAVARGAQLETDGDRVMFLAAGAHPLLGPQAVAADVADGRLRAALLGGTCGATGRDCTPAEAWIRQQGTDVSLRVGQPERGFAYALSAGTTRGSRTSAASTRTAHARRRRRPRPAIRGPRPRRGRARPARRPRIASSAAR
jgi:4-amino-4-deoxy-L-arabinose transferase-like glycosyltransferase